MTFVVKAAGAADLLALIPALVGFPPRNSIVLLAFRGSRTCGALRANLPNTDDHSAHRRLASYLLGTICKIPDADAVVIAIFTDEAFDGSSTRPREDLVSLIGERVRQTGFELRDSLCVAADGWGSYDDGQLPVGGHPLSEIAQSTAGATIPPDARPASANPAIRIADADPATKDRVAAQLAQYRRAVRALRDDEGLLDESGAEQSDSYGSAEDESVDASHARDDTLDDDRAGDRRAEAAGLAPLLDLPALAEEALLWEATDIDAHGALLLFAVQGPPVRDTVMLQWATSFAVGVRLWDETQNAGAHGLGFDPDLGDLMLGVGPRPDPARIERGIALMSELVSRAADEERCAPLCMLAWLNWAQGRGSVAAQFVMAARGIDPDYSMAQLLQSMLMNGVLPEWAFNRTQ